MPPSRVGKDKLENRKENVDLVAKARENQRKVL